MHTESDRLRAALGDFLRSRRAAYDVGRLPLPTHGPRRVPGIRRDELAVVAGVSTSYYTRIEQGAVTASASVLDAIADALGLDTEDRAHMHRLSAHQGRPTDDGAALVGVLERLERVLGSLDVPAAVLGRDTRLHAWNRLAHLVFAPHVPFEAPWSENPPTWAHLLFLDDACRALFRDWEPVAADLVGRLRAAQSWHLDAPDLQALVTDLLGRSPDFARLWKVHPVRERPLGFVRLRHAVLGDLELSDTTLRPTERADIGLFVFHPEPDSETARKLSSAAESAIRGSGPRP